MKRTKLQTRAPGSILALLIASALAYTPGGAFGQTASLGEQCVFFKEQVQNSVTWPRIRMDMNADYLMFAGPTRENRAFILEAEFPYAAYVAATVYSNAIEGIPYSTLGAEMWVPDSGDMADNPWTPGSLVNSPPENRKVTIVLTPRKHVQTALDLGYRNVIALPPPIPPIPPAGELPGLGQERFSPLFEFVYRVYLAARWDPNSDPANPTPFNTDEDFDRRGYVPQPTIRAVSAIDLETPRACPITGDSWIDDLQAFKSNVGTAAVASVVRGPKGNPLLADDQGFYDPVGGSPHDAGNFGNPPDVPGQVAFFRLPIPLIQYAGAGSIPSDGSQPVNKLLECTGYLSAGIYEEDQVNIVGFATQPDFFDTSGLMPGSGAVFERGEVLYRSLGAFGAQTLTINENAMIPDITTMTTKRAGPVTTVYVTVPDSIFFDDDGRDLATIRRWAARNDLNVMPSSSGDNAFVPVLIYRNKGNDPADGIDCRGLRKVPKGKYCSIRKSVPCPSTLATDPDTGAVERPFQLTRWSEADPNIYGASETNMGPYAPRGLACGELPRRMNQGYLKRCLKRLIDRFE